MSSTVPKRNNPNNHDVCIVNQPFLGSNSLTIQAQSPLILLSQPTLTFFFKRG